MHKKTENTDVEYIKKSLNQITELLYDTIKGSGEDRIEGEEQIPYWSHKDDLLSILTKILVLKNKIMTLDVSENGSDTFEFNEAHDKEILANYIKKHSSKAQKTAKSK